MDKFPITKEGYTALEKEHKKLKTVDRPAIIQAIAEARAHGDLKENAEYHAAKEKQSFIEGRIKEVENVLACAEIIDVESITGVVVKLGARIKIVDEDTEEEHSYQIVGEYEADLSKGKIALTAPIARALIGKKKDESVEVNTPKGLKYYTILDVAYG